MFLQVLASVFVVELGVMWLLPLFRPLSPGVTMLVDAGLLALGCAPILWWVVAAPLRAAAEGDRARAALLQGVLDGSIDAIVTVDAHQRVVIFSTGAEQLFGWRADEIIGQPLSVLLPDRVREAHAGHVAGFQRSSIRHKAMQQRSVVAARRKDGTEVHVEASLSKVVSGGALYMTAIVRDVTQREAAEEELRAALVLAEQAARAKSEFVASMSHELRTPLNAILGMSETLRDQGPGPLNARQLASVNDVVESGRLLLALINDILDLSRIETGNRHVERREVAMRDVLNAAVYVVREPASKKSLTLTVDLACPDIVLADGRALKQIIANLMRNAVKFTMAGGRILLRASVEPSDAMLVVVIQDTGIGIAAENLPRLFHPFEQLEGGVARRFGGSGLGLALSARLAEQQGGTIAVESVLGAGSTFTVRIPVEIPDSTN